MLNIKTLALFPVLFFLLLNSFAVHANQEQWNKGIIYLNNNEAIKGELRYDQELNLVQYKDDDKIKVFTPLQVKLFQFYDPETATNKVFTTISEEKPGNWQKKAFYEVVLTGNISILRMNEHISIKQVPVSVNDNPLIRGNQYHYVEQTKHDYFILHNDKLTKLKRFKKDVLPLIGISKKELKDFIAENGYTLNSRKDQLKVIEHFNKLNRNTSISLL